MRWGEQITLIALSEPSPRTNEHGFPVARTETATTVFADKKSVGFSEFYKAQQAGYTTYKKQCFGKTRSLKKPCRKCSKRVAQ